MWEMVSGRRQLGKDMRKGISSAIIWHDLGFPGISWSRLEGLWKDSEALWVGSGKSLEAL